MGRGPSRRSLWLRANDQISDLMTGWPVWEKPLPAFLSAQVLQGLQSQGPEHSMAQNHSLSQEKSGEALQRPRGTGGAWEEHLNNCTNQERTPWALF